jgi:hypothetical protein
MNDLSTSFGSKSFQSLKLYFFPAAQIWYW